ncbi:MAG: HpcH/HpaI aldolase/citrate lyase family protein [Sphaerochaetaceae bacterium]|nr:HpcH/HpaI aldolase/citrate lyase family protein [Sphaerochaetaceae bacterium]
MKDRLRRTMLYVPGNNTGIIRDAAIYRSDSIMIDLEDSVSYRQKDAARLLVYTSLRTFDFEGVETVVRINGLDTPYGLEDIEAMVKARPDIIRLPKTDCAQDVQEASRLILLEEKKNGLPEGSIGLMAAIESPLGVINAYEIACASERLVGIAIGAEDYVTAMKTSRSADGIELLYARSAVVTAARAAGIQAYDTVYSDLNNEEGFRREVELIRQLGFDGKSIISPRQIKVVHDVFTPSVKEIELAQKVVEAIDEANAKGSGVIAVDGKMIDKPIVERAKRTLEMASASGVLSRKEGRYHA